MRVLVLLVLMLSLVLAGVATAKRRPVAGNPADRLAPLPIDDYRYDRAHHCLPKPAKGALALEAWLSRNMDRYSLCFNRRGRLVRISDTLAHRDHVHIGLSRPGAAMRTSFWRRGR